MPTAPFASGLTPNQEAFCRALARGADICAAYGLGYRCARLKVETVQERAKELALQPAIAAAVWGLRVGIAARHVVTVEALAQELEEARALAIDKGHSAAAVSATLGKAKLHGLPIDRKGAFSDSLESMTDAELDAYIDRLESEVQADAGGRETPLVEHLL